MAPWIAIICSGYGMIPGCTPHNLSYSSIVANLVGTTIFHWSCISNSILVNQENAFEYFVIWIVGHGFIVPSLTYSHQNNFEHSPLKALNIAYVKLQGSRSSSDSIAEEDHWCIDDAHFTFSAHYGELLSYLYRSGIDWNQSQCSWFLTSYQHSMCDTCNPEKRFFVQTLHFLLYIKRRIKH